MKFKEIIQKMKLDKHSKIERFGILFMVAVLGLTISTGSIFATKLKKDKVKLVSTSVYTKEFITSKSEIRGVVQGLYRSDDSTKGFLLLKFEDMSKLSLDANKYKLFITGTLPDGTKDKLKSNPTGYVFVLGSTGYVGVLLYDPNGFPNQVNRLTLQVKDSINATGDMAKDNDADLFHTFINIGASDCKVIKSLDNNEINIFNIYNETVADAEEAKLKEELGTTLVSMRDSLKLIKEYKERILKQGVVTSKIPSVIGDDSIKEVKVGDKTYLKLKSPVIVRGGLDFDWQERTLKDGYIDRLIATSSDKHQTYAQFIAKISADDRYDATYDLGNIKYYRMMDDGKKVEFAKSALNNDIANNRMLSENIGLFESELTKYYTLKQKYQTELLQRLILLEISVKDASENYSVTTAGSEALKTY